MAFYDRNGIPLAVGDAVTIEGKYLGPGYLDGANEIIERFGETRVYVTVNNLRGLPRIRALYPDNLRKGHHGIDPGKRYVEFARIMETRFALLSLMKVLDEAVVQQIITTEQREAVLSMAEDVIDPEI